MEVENKKLTPEMLKKLADIGGLGFTEKSKFPYVLKKFRNSDIPKEYWPVFILQGKDGIESIKFQDGLGHMEIDKETETQRWISKSGQKRLETLREGIKHWHTYFDSEGNEIPFSKQGSVISNNSLKRIPNDDSNELYNAIVSRTILTPEELTGLEYSLDI